MLFSYELSVLNVLQLQYHLRNKLYIVQLSWYIPPSWGISCRSDTSDRGVIRTLFNGLVIVEALLESIGSKTSRRSVASPGRAAFAAAAVAPGGNCGKRLTEPPVTPTPGCMRLRLGLVPRLSWIAVSSAAVATALHMHQIQWQVLSRHKQTTDKETNGPTSGIEFSAF